jgi:hypothetical protein
MGWEDCHLHEFRIGGQRFGIPDPMDTFMGGPGSANEKVVRLTTSATVGSIALPWRRCCGQIQDLSTRYARTANFIVRPKTVAESGAFTTSWKPWPTRLMTSMKNCWNGSETASILHRFHRLRCPALKAKRASSGA